VRPLQRTDRIYAWIATKPDGSQVLPTVAHEGVLAPLIGTDLEQIERLWTLALTCLETCPKVELVEFSDRRVLATHRAIRPTVKL
jgi:hypothetical protein